LIRIKTEIETVCLVFSVKGRDGCSDC